MMAHLVVGLGSLLVLEPESSFDHHSFNHQSRQDKTRRDQEEHDHRDDLRISISPDLVELLDHVPDPPVVAAAAVAVVRATILRRPPHDSYRSRHASLILSSSARVS